MEEWTVFACDGAVSPHPHHLSSIPPPHPHQTTYPELEHRHLLPLEYGFHFCLGRLVFELFFLALQYVSSNSSFPREGEI